MKDRTLLALLQYARAREMLLRKQGSRERVLFLAKNPQAFSEDDADMLVDVPSDVRCRLLKKHDSIRQLYEEYRETPEKISSTFFNFMRRAWRHAIPDPLAINWHHKVLCDEYERVASGDTLRLIVNQPPGTTKTATVGIFFQAWRWSLDPTESAFFGSYSEDLIVKTSAIFLKLIQSEWYQRRWGHKFRLTKEADRTVYNDKGGWRLSRGVGGQLTGEHPLYIVIDDPSKAIDSVRPAELRKVAEWYSSTVSTRGMLKSSRHIIVMQRLAVNDLTGVLLGESDLSTNDLRGFQWRHACVPMHFSKGHPYPYEFDPRTEEGELLWPSILSEDRVQAITAELERQGIPNSEAQFEQNPRLIRTRLFGDCEFALIGFDDLPRTILSGRAVRAWDIGDSTTGDWTVGALVVEHSGVLYVLDIQRFRLQHVQRDEAMLRVAASDKKRFPEYRVVREVAPGPDGKAALASFSAKMLKEIGVIVMGSPVSKNKVERATPVASMVRDGFCRILRDKPWTNQALGELATFPGGAHDDVPDALAHGQWALLRWANGEL